MMFKSRFKKKKRKQLVLKKIMQIMFSTVYGFFFYGQINLATQEKLKYQPNRNIIF